MVTGVHGRADGKRQLLLVFLQDGLKGGDRRSRKGAGEHVPPLLVPEGSGSPGHTWTSGSAQSPRTTLPQTRGSRPLRGGPAGFVSKGQCTHGSKSRCSTCFLQVTGSPEGAQPVLGGGGLGLGKPAQAVLSLSSVVVQNTSRSSHCGTTGSVVSLQRQDTGLIPSLVQWVKDPKLPQRQCRSHLQLRSDPWPRNSICYGAAMKKMRKLKNKTCPQTDILFVLVMFGLHCSR